MSNMKHIRTKPPSARRLQTISRHLLDDNAKLSEYAQRCIADIKAAHADAVHAADELGPAILPRARRARALVMEIVNRLGPYLREEGETPDEHEIPCGQNPGQVPPH